MVRIAASAPDARSAELTLRSLEMVFNAGTNLDPTGTPAYAFSLVEPGGVAAARAEVAAGTLDGLLVLTHGPEERLDFEYVTANPASRQAILFQLVAVAVAASIRADEAKGLIGDFVVTDAVPGDVPGGSELDTASRQILATILVMLVFVTSVTYGMWVATSVAEEKSSRVMELMLNAATPGEMLAGKVLGVGGAGLTQLAAIVLPAAAVVALQGPLDAPRARGGCRRHAARRPDAGHPRRVRRLLPARLRADRPGLRRRGLARQPPGGRPAGGPADADDLVRGLLRRLLRLRCARCRRGSPRSRGCPSSAPT